MTKLILTLITSLIISIASFGQTITYEDFKEVIPFLQKEDFNVSVDDNVLSISR